MHRQLPRSLMRNHIQCPAAAVQDLAKLSSMSRLDGCCGPNGRCGHQRGRQSPARAIIRCRLHLIVPKGVLSA